MTEKKELTINQKLVKIQHNLKANKGQFNKFGNYSYRSCEDILEAVKPLLNEYDCHLTLTDEPVLIGDRYYIKSLAIIKDNSDIMITAKAYAREPIVQKGMSDAQVTGSTSSYARKYALNGLFAIDDAKDADTQDNRANGNNNQTPSPGKNTNNSDAFRFQGGKNKGKTIAECDDDFLQWVKVNHNNQNIRELAMIELGKRGK